jgi:hypothetical protein
MVLSLFLSATSAPVRLVDVVGGRVTREAGVAGVVVFLKLVGLVAEGREVVGGRTVLLLAGVPTTLRVVPVAEERSLVTGGAIDIRLGRAAMPSFLSSALSSPTELREVRGL